MDRVETITCGIRRRRQSRVHLGQGCVADGLMRPRVEDRGAPSTSASPSTSSRRTVSDWRPIEHLQSRPRRRASALVPALCNRPPVPRSKPSSPPWRQSWICELTAYRRPSPRRWVDLTDGGRAELSDARRGWGVVAGAALADLVDAA
jgi:hypothetical protein